MEEDFGDNTNDSVEETVKEKEKSTKKAITIDSLELQDFLADMSRLEVMINSTSSKMDNIVKHTNIVSNLQSIADMDLLKFQSKFENAIQNLDLQRYAKDAIQDSLAPLVSEYKDSNALLKSLIFELEKRHMPEKKKSSKVKIFSIAGITLLMVGILGFFLYVDNYIVEP
nr:hypothetical protein [uncultured Sulfurimonas sp.]